jgi:hypothetical protein
MDCPICFNKITHSCVGPCLHHFCYPCLFQWMSKKNTCPVCREHIFEIRFDKEFDFINGCPDDTFRHPNEIKIKFQEGTGAGVTLKNNDGPGVKIKSLKENGQFFIHGFKVGTVILFINNIPCNNHKEVIDVIDKYDKNNIPIILNTLQTINKDIEF